MFCECSPACPAAARKVLTGAAAPRPALAVPHLRRAQLGQRPATRSTAPISRAGRPGLSVAFDLPTQTGYDSDHPLARGRGRQGRRADRHDAATCGAVRGHPARADEHLDDDQRHRPLAAGALHRGRRAAGRGRGRSSQGTVQNDIIKEYLSRGTYIFPPEPVAAADHRRDRLHLPRAAALEPDQRLQLPPAGGGRHAGAGAGLRAGHRGRGAGRGPRRRPGAGGRPAARWSGGSASSSTPASASSPSCARCAPSSSCGTRSAASATASRRRSTASSATACRSTRWA